MVLVTDDDRVKERGEKGTDDFSEILSKSLTGPDSVCLYVKILYMLS